MPRIFPVWYFLQAVTVKAPAQNMFPVGRLLNFSSIKGVLMTEFNFTLMDSGVEMKVMADTMGCCAIGAFFPT